MEDRLFLLRIRLSAYDYVNANRFGLLRNVPVMAGTAALTLSLIVGLSTVITGKPFDVWYVAFTVILLVMAYFLFFPMTVRQLYRKDRRMRQEIDWKIGEDGLETSNQSASDKYSWPEFECVHISGKYYFFQLKKPLRIIKFLPKRAFPDNEALKLFEDFIKTKLIVR